MSGEWFHDIGGTRYPRVTSIIDILVEPGLDDWRARVGAEAADKKAAATARTGKAVHGRIDQFLRGKKVTPTKSPTIARGWAAWQAWWACQSPATQQAARSWQASGETLRRCDAPHGGYSGTPDLGVSGDVRDVYDWKTTSRIRERFWIQLHAYVPLLWPDWETASRPIRLHVVRVDADLGIFQPQTRTFNPSTLRRFFDLLAVYREWFFDPAINRLEAASASQPASPEEDESDGRDGTDVDVADGTRRDVEEMD